jgi:hypothetical protein
VTERTLIDVDTGDLKKHCLPGPGDVFVVRFHTEQFPASLKTCLPVPVGQKAKVSYLYEPVREYVKQKPPDELICIKGHSLFLVSVRVVFPGERDHFIVCADDTMVRDGNPMCIPCEILNDRFGAIKGRLAVDHPFFGIKPVDVRIKGLLDKREEFPLKEPRHNLYRQEELSLCGYPSVL